MPFVQMGSTNREYNIIFRPATTIKSQILADFMAEFSSTILPAVEEEANIHKDNNQVGEWKLHPDGSKNMRGAWVGIILISPIGDTTSRAIKMQLQNDQ